ncbi:hypothetical protein K443DRAFT_114909 [Laccaria amethystina LaAM-08-1]|uniref:Uncharacterized protein n=1 Tax=Laccaria amethystina LaAM-08-1 TaxID=1095629 RepID=A0A0C9WHN9_9AGAR|nr:hypothetical protein K443DRAFT_114909 [Laccaria amethystina LaAM-08-1]
MRRMVCLPVPTPAAVWFSVLRADAVLWFSPLRSQHSAAPPTARPNDNHPAAMRYSAAKPGQKTSQLTIADGRSTIEDPSGEARGEGRQDHPCDPPPRSSSASVGPCPHTAHETQPALVRSSEEDASERDEKGPRRWMTGGRARMTSSVIGSLGPPWMMVKEPAMCARLF